MSTTRATKEVSGLRKLEKAYSQTKLGNESTQSNQTTQDVKIFDLDFGKVKQNSKPGSRLVSPGQNQKLISRPFVDSSQKR